MAYNQLIHAARSFLLIGSGLLTLVVGTSQSLGFERYKNASGTGNCSTCHGDFPSDVSPKDSVFPLGNKHEMHRRSTYMSTDCDLCHTTGDGRNPYIGSSDGIPGEVPGLGCTGCHQAVGLRKHHAVNGIALCAGCHTNDVNLAIPPEDTSPPYYGTAYTQVRNPCNAVATANVNENWTVGDFIGLDNDGNNVYDRLDPACTPYRIVQIVKENNDVRISWETTGGRTDVVQSSSNAGGPYSDLGTPITIPGTAVVTTNKVDLGGGGDPRRFYRLLLIP